MSEDQVPERVSYFEAVGGEPTFRKLVATFYEGVAGDPVLRAVYPEQDLGPAEERLRLFLMLRHMTAAVDSLGLPPELQRPLLDYLQGAAEAMVNRF